MISVRDTPRLTCNFVFSVVKTVKTNSNSHKEFYGIISGTRNSSCSLLMIVLYSDTAKCKCHYFLQPLFWMYK